MRDHEIMEVEALLTTLGRETSERQIERLRREDRQVIDPEALLGERERRGDYDTFVTNAIVGVPGDLPLGRVLALTENLQYVYDLALWVEDPYAFRVPNIPGARSSRLRKDPRPVSGYEARVNRLHYGSDPVVDFLVVAGAFAVHELPPLLNALHPYVKTLVSRESRTVRKARQERDIAVYGAETSQAILKKMEIDEQIRERQERDGKRQRDRKEASGNPTTLESLRFDTREDRAEEALRQVEIIKVEIRKEIFGD